jgi:hypothetical protein
MSMLSFLPKLHLAHLLSHLRHLLVSLLVILLDGSKPRPHNYYGPWPLNQFACTQCLLDLSFEAYKKL